MRTPVIKIQLVLQMQQHAKLKFARYDCCYIYTQVGIGPSGLLLLRNDVVLFSWEN